MIQIFFKLQSIHEFNFIVFQMKNQTGRFLLEISVKTLPYLASCANLCRSTELDQYIFVLIYILWIYTSKKYEYLFYFVMNFWCSWKLKKLPSESQAVNVFDSVKASWWLKGVS